MNATVKLAGGWWWLATSKPIGIGWIGQPIKGKAEVAMLMRFDFVSKQTIELRNARKERAMKLITFDSIFGMEMSKRLK